MLRVFEAKLIGYLADRQASLDEQLFGTLNDGILDVALGSGAALLADEVAKVVGRQAGLVGEVGDGGQAVTLGLFAYGEDDEGSADFDWFEYTTK